MCVWVGLSDFGIKYARLLNTPYVKNLISNNILYVVPEDVHHEMMTKNGFNYIMKGSFSGDYINRAIGRVRSIDANNHAIEIDINPAYADYINNMKDPKISFLAYTGLNKTGPILYIHDARNSIEEELAV